MTRSETILVVILCRTDSSSQKARAAGRAWVGWEGGLVVAVLISGRVG